MAFGNRQSPRPYDACSISSPSQGRSLLPVCYPTSPVLCPESPLNCHVVLSVTAVQLWKAVSCCYSVSLPTSALFKNMILVNYLVSLWKLGCSGFGIVLGQTPCFSCEAASCLSFQHLSQYFVCAMTVTEAHSPQQAPYAVSCKGKAALTCRCPFANSLFQPSE